MSDSRSLFEDELPRRQGSTPKPARDPKPSGGTGGRYWAGTPKQRLRVALGMRQAVLKITSYGSGRRKVYEQFLYVTRNGRLEFETDRGETLLGQDAMNSLLTDWAERFDNRARSRDTVHMVLSAPAGTDPEKLKQAVREFADETFAGNHNYGFALHTDCKHPHLHLLVGMRGHNGEKLDPRKYELARWRECFAEKAREQGIELDASPRYARGNGRKGERQVYRHIRSRGCQPQRFEDAASEVVAEGRSKPYEPNEFETAQAATNQRERAEYRELAAKYKRLAHQVEDPAEARLAASLARTFAAYEKSMPVPESQRQQMLRASAARALISPDGAPRGAQTPGPAPSDQSRSPDGEQGPEK